MTIRSDALWLITGTSSGLGRSLARAVIAQGYRLLATARDVASLEALTALAPDRVRALALDVRDPRAVKAAVEAGESWGGIDVLVNNAGHGYLAAVEEGEDDKIREVFEVNFFAAAALIRAVLPGMRHRRRGHIVNVTSVAGLVGRITTAYYAASKFALEGLSDGLADEVKEFGIEVTLVEPGPIRTAFAGRSIRQSPVHPAYERTAGVRRKSHLASDGRQAGDPDKMASLMIAAIQHATPPRRLILGNAALAVVSAKLDQVRSDLEAYRDASSKTDMDDAPA